MGKNAVLGAVVLASFLAVAQSGVIVEPEFPGTFSVIDPIIKGMLEGMRPMLANLSIPLINETVSDPALNASVLLQNITVRDADKFVIRTLRTTLLPPRLANLTLTWNRVGGHGLYDFDARLRVPQSAEIIRLFGKGRGQATLFNFFITVGANLELKNNAIQIKNLFGFDVRIGRLNVTLSSVMGSPELGNAIGVYLSNTIPQLVDTLKKPVFEALHDDLVKIINDILRQEGALLMDSHESDESSEEFSLPSFDLTGELGFLEEF